MAGELAPVWGLLCRTWWLEGPKVDPKGLPRPPKRDPKIIENSLKIHPGPPWPSPGCQGVPPRCLQASRDAYLCVFMHVYAHIYYILCIFMHILCIFTHVFISFMHIYAYCCTRHPYLCIFYVYLCIFKHIYECVCIFDAYLYTSAFFMHIYTYSHISIHEKTLIRCQ